MSNAQEGDFSKDEARGVSDAEYLLTTRYSTVRPFSAIQVSKREKLYNVNSENFERTN